MRTQLHTYGRRLPFLALFVALSLFGLGFYSWSEERLEGVEVLSQELESGKPRFFLRDWSLALGFNNLRYNIEAAVLQAKLLGRTLVLPSFVYLRSCEVDDAICALYLDQVDRRLEIHSDQWSDEDAMGFRVPMQSMLNITALASEYTPVITMADFLSRHSLPPSLERSDGQTVFTADADAASLLHNAFKVQILRRDEEYDSSPLDESAPRLFRFDALQPVLKDGESSSRSAVELRKWERTMLAGARVEGGHVPYREAEKIMDVLGEEALGVALGRVGWMLAYTFRQPNRWETIKAVDVYETQVIERAESKGWADDYGSSDADILVLPGEMHDGRKPGFMRFSTWQAREEFATHISHNSRPIDSLLEVANELSQAMSLRTQGRPYIGLHMRRGDFVRSLQWSPTQFEDHLETLKHQLDVGREILRVEGGPTDTFPRVADPFFVATDEANPQNLALLREAGAVLLADLLTPEHRRQLGWTALFGDLQSEVEQAVLARAAFFGAGSRSSVPGWVLNQRKALGHAPQTGVLID